MTVTATFAGVANVLITDGKTSILIDGYFSRPSLLKMASARLRPDERKIKYALNHLGVPRAVHWDAFWRPLTKALKPIARPFDRITKTMSDFGRLATRDGADVRLAKLWERETVLD